jgi:hypothetical protein
VRRCTLIVSGAYRRGTERDQDIRVELHQLGGEIGYAIVGILAEAVADDDALALDIAELNPLNVQITPDGKLAIVNNIGGGQDGGVDTVGIIDLKASPSSVSAVRSVAAASRRVGQGVSQCKPLASRKAC